MTSYYVPLTIGACYLAFVYLLKAFMENRERVPAKKFSLVHNFNMYAISIVCFVGIAYGVAQTLYVRPAISLFKSGLNPLVGSVRSVSLHSLGRVAPHARPTWLPHSSLPSLATASI